MLSDASWSDILSSLLVVFVISVFVLIGLFFYYIVKSYIKSNPVAKSTPNNQFLNHLSNVGQALILLSFNDLIVRDILDFKNYLFTCISVHLSRILTGICIFFILSLSMLECFKKMAPHSYLDLTQFVVDYLAGVVIISAIMTWAYAEVGWCDSWDVCSVEIRCDAPFRQAFYAFICFLILVILIGLVLNKTCLKRGLSQLKSCFIQNSQVQPASMDLDEIVSISSNVQVAIPTQPSHVNEEEIDTLVTPATHLMTFIIVSLNVMMLNAVCYSVGHCSETFNHFCRIAMASLTPAIWICTNPKSRKFAIRKVRIWLQLEQ